MSLPSYDVASKSLKHSAPIFVFFPHFFDSSFLEIISRSFLFFCGSFKANLFVCKTKQNKKKYTFFVTKCLFFVLLFERKDTLALPLLKSSCPCGDSAKRLTNCLGICNHMQAKFFCLLSNFSTVLFLSWSRLYKLEALIRFMVVFFVMVVFEQKAHLFFIFSTCNCPC